MEQVIDTSAKVEAVTKEQFLDAIKKVRDMLATDTLPGKFNMRVVRHENDCGTACCIGGWAEHVLGVTAEHSSDVMDMFDSRTKDRRLYDLFYNFGQFATREDAVKAIDRYFLGVDDPWGFYDE